jgi:hypothetical protein
MSNNYQQQRTVQGVPVVTMHGKNYVEVATRVNAVHEAGKDFEVLTSEPYTLGDRVLWRVVISVEGKMYTATAEAKLNAAKGTPDGTNPFECAETSALGRALAFAGFGSVERIASYDEVARSRPGASA